MRILALDIATKTGWATGLHEAGTWNLMTPSEVTAQAKLRFDRRCDSRIPRLYGWIGSIHRNQPLDWIVFEDVQFASTTMQAHLWASLRAAAWLFSNLNGVKIECLATGKLKLSGAGHGTATKEMMAAHWVKKHPEFRLHPKGVVDSVSENILDDNAVDALHLYEWATQTLKT